MPDARTSIASDRADQAPALARAIWHVLAARSGELSAAGVIDDASFAAVARGLDVARAGATSGEPCDALIEEFERGVETVLPAELSGVLALGGAREEVAATVLRMTARDHALSLLRALDGLRSALLDVAEEHTNTHMPALIGGGPAQPTTFAHFLGGVVAPLGSATERLRHVYVRANRSPLGAGALAGGMIEVDRQRLAITLGFVGPIANTFDAVANIEDLVALAECAAASVAPVCRWLDELLLWLRTHPASMRLGDEWLARPEPSLPQLTVPRGLERLTTSLRQTERAASTAVAMLRACGYAPIGANTDAILTSLNEVSSGAVEGLRATHRLVASGLTVNRAYLANRAGRAFTTSGDLAAFLMTEERLPPSVAQAIAGTVISEAMEAGVEVNSITPEAIDAVSFAMIGRDLKVEMETLGRYLAPRRFLERRQVTGSPAPAMTRAWLAEERDQLAADREWQRREQDRITGALASLSALVSDAVREHDP